MTNTFNLLAERLKPLAELDPATADLLASLPVSGSAQEPDPMQEATFTASWLGELAAEPAPDVVIMLGWRGGLSLQSVLNGLPKTTRVLVLEYDLAQAVAAYRQAPIEPAIAEGRLVLAIGSDPEFVQARIYQMLDMHNPPTIRLFDSGLSAPEASRFYVAMLKDAMESVHLNVFNLNTLIGRGPLWQYNTLKNLPYLITHPGINALIGKFAGKPALIVGAGPSLNKALPYLKEVAKHYVILCAATALRPLRAAGITPDLVVAVDASKKTAPQFEAPCEDVYLACSSIVYPPALPKFKGIFSGHLNANPIERWLSERGSPKGLWIAAGTVTTTAVDLAIQMGCNPIVSLGFDLSFAEDGTTHATGTMYHGVRLNPAQLVRVPGNYQPEVVTTEQFKIYITLLEKYVESRSGIRFINATFGGARIKGMELQTPESLAQWGAEPFDAQALIRTAHTDYNRTEVGSIRHELATIIDELERLVTDAQQGARICNRILMMLKSPQADDEAMACELLKTLEEIDQRFLDTKESSMLLDMSLWPISYQSAAPRTNDEKRYTDAMLVNRRTRELYEQMAGAAKWTRLLLMDVKDELDRRLGGDLTARVTDPSAIEPNAVRPLAEAL